MTDKDAELIARLLRYADPSKPFDFDEHDRDLKQAASALAAKDEEIERLRGELTEIANRAGNRYDDDAADWMHSIYYIACRAIGQNPERNKKHYPETAIARARSEALEEALRAQPATAENPTESTYHRGYFDGVMAYGRAIRALKGAAE